MRFLDKRRPYGVIYGISGAKFEQDGISFNSDGTEFGVQLEIKPCKELVTDEEYEVYKKRRDLSKLNKQGLLDRAKELGYKIKSLNKLDMLRELLAVEKNLEGRVVLSGRLVRDDLEHGNVTGE